MAFFGALFGLMPAYVRLLVRRQVRRRQRDGGRTPVIGERAQAVHSGRPPQPAGPAEPGSTSSTPTPAFTSEPSGGSASADAELPALVPPRVGEPPYVETPARAPLTGRPPTGASDARKRQLHHSPTDDNVFATAREVLPYPVARAARAVQLATDPADAYRALLRCGKAACVVLGITATAWARQHGVVTKELQALQAAYLERGVSQGHWLAVA